MLRASVTHGDTTLRAERRLTPGFGWALLLPIDYPLDQADHWTSAVWVALPLLLAGFWLGRGRVGVPVLMALGVTLLGVGLEGVASLAGLARDGAPAWGLGALALLAGWMAGRYGVAESTAGPPSARSASSP